MNWFKIKKINDTTFIISEHLHWGKTNCYLLLGTKFACLIDTGIGLHSILKEVRKITNLPIKVITTHTHWDHIGNIGEFDNLYLHSNGINWIKNGIPLNNKSIEQILVRNVRERYLPRDFKYVCPFNSNLIEVEDGEEIDLGNRKLKILYTPGHSPCHICLLEERTGFLFTGDLIYRGALLCHFPSTNPNLYFKSLKKLNLLQKTINKIFPGHNKTPLDPEYITNIYSAFQTIASSGLLKHGSGNFEYDDFQIIL